MLNFQNGFWRKIAVGSMLAVMGMDAGGCAQYGLGGFFSKQASPGDVAFGLLAQNASSKSQKSSPAKDKDASAASWTAIQTVKPEDFGGFIALGDTTPLVVTLKNPGQLPVQDFSFAIDPPTMTENYNIVSDCTVLNATGLHAADVHGVNETCSVTVSFNPQILQEVKASLVVTYNTNKGKSKSSLPLNGLSAAIPYYWFVAGGANSVGVTCGIVDFGQVIIDDGKDHIATTKLHYNANIPGAKINGVNMVPTASMSEDPNTGEAPSLALSGSFSSIAAGDSKTTCNLTGSGTQSDDCLIGVSYKPTVPTGAGQFEQTTLTFAYAGGQRPYACVTFRGFATKINPLQLGVQSAAEGATPLANTGSVTAPQFSFATAVRNPQNYPGDILLTFSAVTPNIATQPAQITGASLLTQGGGAPDSRLSIVQDPTISTCLAGGAWLKPNDAPTTCNIQVHLDMTSQTPFALSNQQLRIDYKSTSNAVDYVAQPSLLVGLGGKTIHPPTFAISNLSLASVPAYEFVTNSLSGSVAASEGIGPIGITCTPDPTNSTTGPVLPGCTGASVGVSDFTLGVAFQPTSNEAVQSKYLFSFDDGTVDHAYLAVAPATDNRSRLVTISGQGSGNVGLVVTDAPVLSAAQNTATSITTTGINFGEMLYGNPAAAAQAVTLYFYGSVGVASITGKINGSATASAANTGSAYFSGGGTFPGGGSCSNNAATGGAIGVGTSCNVSYAVWPKPIAAAQQVDGTAVSGVVTLGYTPVGGSEKTINVGVAGRFWNLPIMRLKYGVSLTKGGSLVGSTADQNYAVTPAVTSAPALENFGTVLLNDWATHLYTISNVAANTLNPFPVNVTDIYLGGKVTSNPSTGFSIVSPPSGVTCAAGTGVSTNVYRSVATGCSFGLRFSPGSGAVTGTDTLTIKYADGSGTTRTVTQSLKGTVDSTHSIFGLNSVYSGIALSATDNELRASGGIQVDYKAGAYQTISASLGGAATTGFSLSTKADCAGAGATASCTATSSAPSCVFYACFNQGSNADGTAKVYPPAGTLSLGLSYGSMATVFDSDNYTAPGALSVSPLSASVVGKLLNITASSGGGALTPVFEKYSTSPTTTVSFTIAGDGTPKTAILSLNGVNAAHFTAGPVTGACVNVALSPGGTSSCTMSSVLTLKSGLVASATPYSSGAVTFSATDQYNRPILATSPSILTSQTATQVVQANTAVVAFNAGASGNGTFASAKQNTDTQTRTFYFDTQGQLSADSFNVQIMDGATPDVSGAVYTQTNNCGVSQAAGAECAVTVTASQNTLGTTARTLQVSYTYVGAAQTPAPVKVPLSITIGANEPAVTATLSTPSFGRVLGGQTSGKITVTFSNSGTSSAHALDFKGGPNSGQAMFTYFPGGSPGSGGNYCVQGGDILPGKSCVLDIIFQPNSGTLGAVTGSWPWSYTDGTNNCSPGGSPYGDCAAIGLSGISTQLIQVFAGGSTTCIIDDLQKVRCWGNNVNGQAGPGGSYVSAATAAASDPILDTAAGIIKISVGDRHTCALSSPATGGLVYCWGYNSNGQLGQGNTNNSSVPVPVALGGVATDIASGTMYSCAVVANVAKCWGINGTGQLGIDNQTDSLTPVAAHLTSFPVVSVFAGMSTACAISTSGALRCWGNNWSAQVGLGNPNIAMVGGNASGTTASLATLGDVNLGAGVTAVSVGLSGGTNGLAADSANSYTCVLTNLKDVRCFGATGYLLSAGTVSVTGLLGSVYYNAGNVKGWGKSAGEMGNNLIPVNLGGGGPVPTQLVVGGVHACVSNSSSSGVRCWGADTHGQLGNNSTTPIGNGGAADFASLPDALGVSAATHAYSLSAGFAHTCAVSSANALMCWGGAVGVGAAATTPEKTTATLVPALVFNGAVQ